MTVLWPEVDELKQLLDIEGTDWDGVEYDIGVTRLTRLLEAAIDQVKLDVGNWDEYEDVPDASLAQAALWLAFLMGQRPETRTDPLTNDPTYQRLMYGHHRTFGIA